MKQLATAGVVAFVFFAACGAVCQNVRQPLPDAPSVQVATQAQGLSLSVEEAHSPLTFGAMGGRAGMMRPDQFAFSDKAASGHRDPNAVFAKYLRPSSKQQSGYHSSSSGGLVGRVTHAASRIIVTRDDSGKARLNTPYLLRMLTSVAADTASRPYWRRSFADPFSDFGSTVGNDAGMNVWHEVGPGIQQLMKSHAPKFVARIEGRIAHR